MTADERIAIQREVERATIERCADEVHGSVWACPCCSVERLPHAVDCTYAEVAPEEAARWSAIVELEERVRSLPSAY